MTRAYILIVGKGNKVLSVGYSGADSYLSGLGVEVISAIEEDELEGLINQYGLEENQNFHLNWVLADKESRKDPEWSYEEYGYIYYKEKHLLVVTNWGKKILSIDTSSAERLKVMKAAFEADSTLSLIYSYDAAKLDVGCTEKTYYTFLSSFQSVKEIQAYLDAAPNEFVLITDSHCMAPGWTKDYPMYLKEVMVIDRSWRNALEAPVNFVAWKLYDGKWQIYLQLPFERVPCWSACTTEKKAVDQIRTFLNSDGAIGKIKQFARVCALYKQVSSELNNDPCDTTYQKGLQSLETAIAENPDYAIHHSMTQIISNYRDNYRRLLSK